MLNIIDYIPEGLLETPAARLYDILNSPTLIHLRGKRANPLFVSVLQHGNEVTGLQAVQGLLKKYEGKKLPRALSIFIANVDAAAHGKRLLDGQPDYNRSWRSGDTNIHAMMGLIVDEIRKLEPFASIDIHNNTGLNPHHAAVPKKENSFFQLATIFSRTVVHYIKPLGTQSAAFADICPSVTVECGLPGNEYGAKHASDFLDALLRLEHVPDYPVHDHDLHLFHTVATVKIAPNITFGYGGNGFALNLRDDLDHLNFRSMPAGSFLGNVAEGNSTLLEVWDEMGKEVGEIYLDLEDGKVRLLKEVTPAMFTRNCEIVRQDCLCYFMERLNGKHTL